MAPSSPSGHSLYQGSRWVVLLNILSLLSFNGIWEGEKVNLLQNSPSFPEITSFFKLKCLSLSLAVLCLICTGKSCLCRAFGGSGRASLGPRSRAPQAPHKCRVGVSSASQWGVPEPPVSCYSPSLSPSSLSLAHGSFVPLDWIGHL